MDSKTTSSAVFKSSISAPSTSLALSFGDMANSERSSSVAEDTGLSARRRTAKPASDTMYTHTNGYKSDSQSGSPSVDPDTVDLKSQATGEKNELPVDDTASTSADPSGDLDSKDDKDSNSTRTTRVRRRFSARSVEGSSRLPRTYIFKTTYGKSLTERSHEPASPAPDVGADSTDGKDTSSAKAKKGRVGRKSGAIKFKNYFTAPTSTSNSRSARRTSNTSTTDQNSVNGEPSNTTADEAMPRTPVDDPVSAHGPTDADNSAPVTPAAKPTAKGVGSAQSSAQRRSTRVRKPIQNSPLTGDVKKTPAFIKRRRANARLTPKAKSTTEETGVLDTPTTGVSNPTTKLKKTNETSPENGNRRFSRSKPTASPETVSPGSSAVAMRTSGRVRKPTIKAIEALQSQQKGRRRGRESHGGDSGPQSASTNQSTVSASRESTATADNSAPSQNNLDIIARQLYDLAAAAISEPSSKEDDVNLEQLRVEWEAREKAEEEARTAKTSPVAPPKTAQVASPESSSEVEPEPVSEDAGTRDTIATLLPTPPGEIDPSVPLDHPLQPRPWTDKDGWTHTGRVNKHGEEYVVVPREEYAWVQPRNFSTNIGVIPRPPPRLKSKKEIDRDEVYGFPPLLGQRNLPHPLKRKARFVEEDVESLLKAREASSESSPRGRKEDPKKAQDERKGESSPKSKRPRLKLVLVDSSKLDLDRPENSSNGQGSLQERRTLAQTTKDKLFPASRKRAHAAVNDTPKDSNADKPTEPQPRKRRRSNAPANAKNQETSGETPARQKRQSGPKTPAGSKPTSPTAKSTPKGRRSIMKKPTSSEQASKPRSIGFTPVNGVSTPKEAESPSIQVRRRRANSGTSGSKLQKSTPNAQADA